MVVSVVERKDRKGRKESGRVEDIALRALRSNVVTSLVSLRALRALRSNVVFVTCCC
jgi:hypothetical protein